MNLKRTKYVSTISIFLLTFLFNYLYEWFPNAVFSIFFPVNNSIWEDIKLIYTTIIFYGLIDYFLLNKYHIPINNFLLSLFTSAITSIPIYLTIYLPFYYNTDNFYIDSSVFLVVIILSQIINYFIQKRNNTGLNIISYISIIVFFTVLGYLTYHPFKTNLFYDEDNRLYGINTYYLGN